MTKRKWTDRPWSAIHLGRNTWVIECADGLIASVEHWSSAVDKADAHLIAAAPDLYEALEASTKQLEQLGVKGGQIIRNLSAMSKARGETNAQD